MGILGDPEPGASVRASGDWPLFPAYLWSNPLTCPGNEGDPPIRWTMPFRPATRTRGSLPRGRSVVRRPTLDEDVRTRLREREPDRDAKRPWVAVAAASAMLLACLLVAGVVVFGDLGWRDGVNLVALVLSVGGIWVGVFQLVLAVRAVRDARNAAEETRERMVATQQLDLLHKVRAIESRLDNASSQHERGAVGDALYEWRETASELQGLVGADGLQNPLKATLRKSVIVVRNVQKDLRADNGTPGDLGQAALVAIGEVCDELSRRIGQLKAR
jgi:hypothetical protein